MCHIAIDCLTPWIVTSLCSSASRIHTGLYIATELPQTEALQKTQQVAIDYYGIIDTDSGMATPIY